ncbi:MAG: alpha-ketoglutarate-dependent dioxygenase AlkB [Flavobacteriales bacterium]
MDLFNPQSTANILPFDGEVIYFGFLLNQSETENYFDLLLEKINWKNDQSVMFGKLITTKRKVAWYGDLPFEYSYSNTKKLALPWSNELLELKQKIEEKTGETYNSCLLNLYHTGEEGMGWHTDKEKELKKNGSIASLSLGAERKFAFKHKESKRTVEQWLENGSLLEMKGKTQEHWLHRLPPTKKVKTPRINLTFRTIINQEQL